MKNKILQTAFDLYRRFGIKSISMDTVAQELAASKKTIYQWFENKDKLVEAALNEFLQQVRTSSENSPENSVEALVKTLRLHNEKVVGINVAFFYDLKKYHFQAHQKLDRYLAEELRPYFIKNLQNGIEKGLYRNDIDPEIVANLCIASFSVVVDQDVFPVSQFNQQEVRMQVFKLFLRGIVTSEGKRFLQSASEEN
ncbi:TetR/AcrR family transcriptional regulator [Adhaeribacter soli]|uniref:TetR/AcrR family transcriptional regulator n=1 Tax=Adhaeribacter soli TaxID=2607655 RepID=A0A5N1IXT8_9BACT|nr:TetR/AcrR family transcriptional regulator [Adhaeribacter soli]KAA9339044.1 TetR/AcrR family transcriptional regulator [Adhaeribacter soli]